MDAGFTPEGFTRRHIPRVRAHTTGGDINSLVLQINHEESARYIAEEAARLRYWANHPTFLAEISCSDGRVNLPGITRTPAGLMKPFRVIGGKFQVWWPAFMERMRDWVDAAIRAGARCCVLVTYHYSAGDRNLGCAGWECSMEAARAHAEDLQQRLTFVFGEQMTVIVAGIDTDCDELVLHGSRRDVRGREFIERSKEEIRAAVVDAFPDIAQEMITDLVPFMHGNAEQVAHLQAHPRDLKALEHNERVIAVGHGFSWLTRANFAIIIHDVDPNLGNAIATALRIIERNLADAPDGDDATLFASVPYTKPGIDYRMAVESARGLLAFAKRCAEERAPTLIASGRLHTIVGVTWDESKRLEVIEAR